jgi:hypothetical protein
MCDVLIVVDDLASHGFCSPACRLRNERLNDELDRMMSRLKQARADRDPS